MKKFSKFDTAQIRTGSVFDPLPKGAYIIKILRAAEEQNKKSDKNPDGRGSHVKIAFDVAEGEYRDFYKKQFDASTNEDKTWPYDAIFRLAVPDDDSAQWMIDNFGTFIASLEESNTGYHWDWDETKWKGLVIGALFRNEQSEKDGNVYNHIRPYWFRPAQIVRDGKFGKLPKDKLVTPKPSISGNDFMAIPDGAADETPWG